MKLKIETTDNEMAGKDEYRHEQDSLGSISIPRESLYGPQTQRAVNNFPISGLVFPRPFIKALGLLKFACAEVNNQAGLLDTSLSAAIKKAAIEVTQGKHDKEFPVDIFQTGSGTSTNMNANEVLACLASRILNKSVLANDHVNKCQSSNDVIPSCIHISASLEIHERLLPALQYFYDTLLAKSDELEITVKTGRTHLMDAMPLTIQQEISGWTLQISYAIKRISDSLVRLRELAIGGTAVGTGLNAPPQFGMMVATEISHISGYSFSSKPNYFEALSSQDAAVEMSGQLKTLAVSLMKISNDLRWMNSGPLAGLAEITLPELQAGSSIMPGKVNPVIPEAVTMVCAQVIGNDSTITIAGQSGNFQLNTMLPVIAHNLLQSIDILSNSLNVLATKAIKGFTINFRKLNECLELNPVLVTALNGTIGYEKGAVIAKRAYKEKRPVFDVAKECTDLSDEQLRALLDPKNMV